MSETLDLAIELIRRPSVTPQDAACQELLIQRLEPLGFSVERLRFGDVENFWARRGSGRPLFAFAGHTDVVPAGAEGEWTSPPFSPHIRDGRLYGRGAADMKGSLAAMVVACEHFVRRHPSHHGSIAFLITSDEEGPGVDGTARVIERLSARQEHIDWCLVGEPSSEQKFGDVIKNGRRGSLYGRLRVQLATQERREEGISAEPSTDPVRAFAPALVELCAQAWDQGNEFFAPTGFQVTNLRMNCEGDNIPAGELEARFNFRYSPVLNHEILEARVTDILRRHGLTYSLEWRHPGKPFITKKGELIDATCQAIVECTNLQPVLSTAGGTSDGRFIAPTGAQVVELGPVNASIHKIDEYVNVDDLDRLAATYERILEILLVNKM